MPLILQIMSIQPSILDFFEKTFYFVYILKGVYGNLIRYYTGLTQYPYLMYKEHLDGRNKKTKRYFGNISLEYLDMIEDYYFRCFKKAHKQVKKLKSLSQKNKEIFIELNNEKTTILKKELDLINCKQKKQRLLGGVYFIQDIHSKHIKIGISRKTKCRMNDFRSSLPNNFILLLVISGYRDKEIELHKRFKKDRLCGEWFESTPELLSFIEKEQIKNKFKPITYTKDRTHIKEKIEY